MKFILAFQPIFTQPLGFTVPGHRITVKGTMPRDVPQQAATLLVIEAARAKYRELYPDDSLYIDRMEPSGQLLGGLITYGDSEEELLQKASQSYCREFVESLLKDAVPVDVQLPPPLRKQSIIDPSSVNGPIISPRDLIRGVH